MGSKSRASMMPSSNHTPAMKVGSRWRSIPNCHWPTRNKILNAAWLLVTTLNFTICQTADELTAYAGLAPNPFQSGTSVRGRASIGHTGNAALRTAAYLVTLNAAQPNPVIKAFYERLRAAGKPMKVARCAAARKLLHLAFAVVKHEQDFDLLSVLRQRKAA